MIYRRLDSSGDMTFGQGSGGLLKNTPETVAQAVKTRLGLIQGEWFLDITAGTPYSSKILGAGTITTYDAAIQDVITNTPGVSGIASYSSLFDPVARAASVQATINTQYGQATIQATL